MSAAYASFSALFILLLALEFYVELCDMLVSKNELFGRISRKVPQYFIPLSIFTQH